MRIEVGNRARHGEAAQGIKVIRLLKERAVVVNITHVSLTAFYPQQALPGVQADQIVQAVSGRLRVPVEQAEPDHLAQELAARLGLDSPDVGGGFCVERPLEDGELPPQLLPRGGQQVVAQAE